MSTEEAEKRVARSQTVAYQEYLTCLREACEWAEVGQSRAARYCKLVEEFYEGNIRSREHLLALNESGEINDLYELWGTEVERFPGLKEQLTRVFKKGPILTEDEKPASSTNRPRNDAFVYLLAGKLIEAGVPVLSVDGIPKKEEAYCGDADVILAWDGVVIEIQCKRPQTESALALRIREACKQLSGIQDRSLKGIVAVDYSAFIRPSEKVLEADSAEQAESFLAKELMKKVDQALFSLLDDKVLGLILFARAPAMVRVRRSPIVSGSGKEMSYFVPFSVTTDLVIGNFRSPKQALLKSLGERLKRSRE